MTEEINFDNFISGVDIGLFKQFILENYRDWLKVHANTFHGIDKELKKVNRATNFDLTLFTSGDKEIEVRQYDGTKWAVVGTCPTIESAIELADKLFQRSGQPTSMHIGTVHNSAPNEV